MVSHSFLECIKILPKDFTLLATISDDSFFERLSRLMV